MNRRRADKDDMSRLEQRGLGVCATMGLGFLLAAACGGGGTTVVPIKTTGQPTATGGATGSGSGGSAPPSVGGTESGGRSGTGGTAATGSGGTPPVGGGEVAGAAGGARGDGGASDAAVAADAGGANDASVDASGSALYNPCPATGPCSILPLGDSITAGTGSTDGGGYRVELFRLATTNGQSITFVGRSASGPATVAGKPFPRSHEGHSGYLIDTGPQRPGLMPLLDDIFAAVTPNIVLLMIGTNDIPWMLDLPNEPARLGLLIDKVTTLAPRALVVVAQIGPSSMDDRTALIQAYNAGIPAVVQQRADAGKHVIMVDMFTPFVRNPSYKTALLFDEVHPNDAGHVILGQTWYAAIRSILPQ
jgi:lysophospholipase L1-like esterase